MSKMNKKLLALCMIGSLSLTSEMFAQVQPITSIGAYYETSLSGNVSYTANSNSYYYGTNSTSNQNDLLLQNYAAGGKNYILSSLTPANVKFRRVNNPNASGDKVILFFEINEAMYTAFPSTLDGWFGSAEKYQKASYIDSMELAFTGRTINRGSDNILGNLGNGQGNNNNVERIDIVFNTPRDIKANNGNGITLFERGAPTSHGAVKIALILSVDAQGNPTSYSNIYTVTNSAWGATDVVTNKPYAIMNSTVGGVPAPYKIGAIDAVNQSIGGVFIPFVGSFGLSATATPTVYGYSIMAGDVTATNSSEILDYTNSSVYPTNTDGNDNTIGGMDLIAVTMDFEDATIDPVTIGGNVFDDGNGLTDATINGTAINSVSGQQLYVTLFDRSTGLVIASVPVAANGSWTMPNIPKNSVYNLSIGTVLGTVGSPNPGASIPSDWKHTAEWQGTSVSGTYPGNVQGDGFFMVTVGSSDITDLSFGLDKKPVPSSQSYTLDVPPAMNSTLTLNGTGATNSPAALNGTDAEDGVKGAGSTFIITSIPAQNELWYNGVKITGTDTIPNFNPALLSVKFTSGGTSSVSFNYTVLDNAGVAGSSVSYFITFPGALPAILSGFTAQLKGKDVQVHWTSTLEMNVGRYLVEHSVNGADFEVIGSQAAKGNSVEINTYNFVHSNVSNGTHYYRLRIQDNDGSSALSAVKMVRLNSLDQITVSPNPVLDKAYIKGLNATDIVSVYDVNGRVVYTSVATGSSITVDFSLLNQGVYFINITDAHSTVKYTGKAIKK
ncbi:hypothetical protein D3C71_168520 [compost metagenome]